MSVTRISTIHTAESPGLEVAAGVDVRPIAGGREEPYIELPTLTLAFGQTLVELHAQSWDHLADLLDELETEVRHAKAAAQREARYEADERPLSPTARIGIQ